LRFPGSQVNHLGQSFLFVAQSGIETDGLTCRKLGVKGGKGSKDVWASFCFIQRKSCVKLSSKSQSGCPGRQEGGSGMLGS
jgi:hypothetical protein